MTTGGAPNFKDHFSGHAAQYADARPTYPDALFRDLARVSPSQRLAWDCATGNGQAARSLAARFERVIATDASAAQIAAADAEDRVEYRVAPAESPGLDAASVDLVTVAQALHWFDIDRFFAAALAVLRPDGVLAYWCYGTCSVSPDCDAITQAAYRHVDAFWPPERTIVEDGYRSIRPPGTLIDLPRYSMNVRWRAEEMLAYLSSWSACQRYRAATGADPLKGFRADLLDRWGSGHRSVSWPLILTAVRKS